MKQSLLNQYFKLKCFLGNNHLGRALNSLYVNKLAYPNGQEPEVLRIAQNYTGVIWDIGAHVGCFADSLASNHNNRVICFECNLSILPILAHNLRNRPNVTIVPLAMDDGLAHKTYTDTLSLSNGTTQSLGENSPHTGQSPSSTKPTHY